MDALGVVNIHGDRSQAHPADFLTCIIARIRLEEGCCLLHPRWCRNSIALLPILDATFLAPGFQNSLGYYFKKFEFNASIYYLVRQLGFWYYGFNIIQTAGWLLGVVSASIILYISMANFGRNPGMAGTQRLNFILLFVILSYSLFTTTLHPWYITTLFALSIFTELRFALLWTAMIFLTYAGYSIHGFEENLWLVAIEYLAVLGYLAYELLWKRKESFLPA